MGRASWGWLLSLVLFAAVSGCWAEQLEGRRGVWGWIRIGQGTVPNEWARVRLFNSSRALLKEVTTDSTGAFSLGALSAGEYLLEVTLPGFKPAQQPINVLRSEQQPLLIVLQPECDGARPVAGILDARIPPAARGEFEKAEEQLRGNRADRARRHLEKAVKLHDAYPAAWRLLAQLDLDREKLDDAEQRLKRAAEFEPGHPDALELEGMLCNRRNQPGEAAEALERSLESKAHCWRAQFELARAYLSLKSFARALPFARGALADHGGPFPEAHVLLGNILLNLKDYAGAARQFAAFLKLAPRSPSAEQARQVLQQMKAAGISVD